MRNQIRNRKSTKFNDAKEWLEDTGSDDDFVLETSSEDDDDESFQIELNEVRDLLLDKQLNGGELTEYEIILIKKFAPESLSAQQREMVLHSSTGEQKFTFYKLLTFINKRIPESSLQFRRTRLKVAESLVHYTELPIDFVDPFIVNGYRKVYNFPLSKHHKIISL